MYIYIYTHTPAGSRLMSCRMSTPWPCISSRSGEQPYAADADGNQAASAVMQTNALHIG